MLFCPKCKDEIILIKDRYDRFEHFFVCQNCHSRFWMSSGRELTKEENLTVEEIITTMQPMQYNKR